ncbi:uncharacterized protein Cyp6a2 [Drosophila virilis]
MLFLIYLLIAISALVVYMLHRNMNFWKSRGIPQEPPHPFYGNLVGFRKNRIIHNALNEYYNKFRKTGHPFVGFSFIQRQSAFIMDIKLAKNILIKDFTNFADRGQFHNERDDPLTGHLFNLDGKRWREMRQKLSPTFTSGKMKFMFPSVIKVSEEFVKVLQEEVPAKSGGAIIEIKDLMARFTTDVIGTCAFGIECNTLRTPVTDFRKMGQKSFTEMRHGIFLTAFSFSFPNLARKLRMRMIPEDVHQFFMGLVQETIALREKENIKRNDFMEMLIELKQKGSFTMDNGEIVTGLDVGELAAQVFVFYLAGFETSSSTMTYSLYELAQHTEIQDKLREDIKDVLQQHDGKLTYESIKAMRYLDQIISETLRLYTIVPFLERKALNDYVVPGHPKYAIEKGTQVIIPAAAYHRDEDLYPDPEKFDPERFSAEQVAARDSVEWLPFGDGPRNCVGMRFGQMQTRIGLAQLIRNFKFSVCDKTDIPLIYDPKSFVLGTIGGIYLRVERVQNCGLARLRSVFDQKPLRAEHKMLLFLIYLLTGLSALVAYFLHHNMNYWKNRGIPQDAPHPLYGNLVGFRKNRVINDIVVEYYNKFRKTGHPFVGFNFLQRRSAFIMNIKLAKNVLIKDFTNFADRGQFHNERDDPLTGHLFNLDGKRWREMRQKLSPTFTSGKMKFMFPSVIKVSEEFVKVLQEEVPAKSGGAIIEIKDLMARFTTDVIGTCAFGIECNTLRTPETDFRKMARKALVELRHGPLLTAFQFSFPNLARKLRMRMIPDDVHEFFMGLVQETIALREKENIKRNDFMEMLIELKQKGSFTMDNGEVVTGLDVGELAAQVFVFYMAGFETSSSTMSYCLYELAQHTDIQDRLREDIHIILQQHDGKLTYESILAMRYLDQVISETLRLYTIVPFLERKALNDYVVPGHPKYVIEKGTQVILPAAAYHRDEDLYPDPEKFDPERFSAEQVAARDSVEWLPFGDGPRNCVGMRFGQMQTRIGLAQLIKNFKFSVCDKTDIPLIYDPKSFVLGTIGGIYMRVEPA